MDFELVIGVIERPDKRRKTDKLLRKTSRKKFRARETHPEGLNGVSWPERWHDVTSTIFIDESGMDALVSGVYACGVYLGNLDTKLPDVHDSKLLKEHEREALFEILSKVPSLIYHVESVSNDEIDALGIGQAWQVLMQRVVANLSSRINGLTDVVIDGDRSIGDIPLTVTAIEKADQKIEGVAAASIFAKVTRDRYMISIADRYPIFKDVFSKSKGYPTEKHKALIREGYHTELHRKTFQPLASSAKVVTKRMVQMLGN